MATALGAGEAGAALMNHASVTGLTLEDGKVRGVELRDEVDGAEATVHARVVVNASGPWSDHVLALERTGRRASLRPTKGVHIAVRKGDFPLDTPVFLRSPDDGRVVWPTPALEGDVVYVGTTDTDYAGDPAAVYPDDEDVRYLLNVANRTIPAARLSERHVVGSWAGLRPLVAPGGDVSAGNTSRGHLLSEGPHGMLTIAGGKLTSSRAMAGDVVDAVARKLGTARRNRAARTVQPGGDMRAADRARAAALAAGVDAAVADAWTRRHGARAELVLAYWRREQPQRTIPDARSLTPAEIHYFVDEEMVRSLPDLLVRRVPVFFWEAGGGLDEVETIASLLGRHLDWDEAERNRQVASYRRLVEKHRFAGTDIRSRGATQASETWTR